MSGLDGLIRALLPPLPPAGAAAAAPLDAAQLRMLLDVGDILTVRVLAGAVGRPTIEIAGRPVLAALPQSVGPGDVLRVRVEGFTPDQVLLKLVETIPAPHSAAGAPAAAPNLASPAAPESQTQPEPQAGSTSPELAPAGASDLRARLAAFRLSTAAGALAPERRAPPPAASSTAAAPGAPAAPPEVQVAPQPSPAPVIAPPRPAVAGARSGPGVAILRALRIPLTPTTLAAARIALEGNVRVTTALETLQRALPEGGQDPRVRQLRTIAEFVGTLDPARPDVLPARIAAYVEHVLGHETALRRALLPAPPAAGSAPQAPPAAGSAPAPPAVVPYPPPSGPPAADGTPPEIEQARALVAHEALAANLKAQVLTLLADTGTAPAVQTALQGALTSITAAQIQTLAQQNASPQALVVPLPLPFPAGGQQAYLRIARDGRRAGQELSAESFHIALVLQTERHGTVAVELLCAGRALSVDVKAERESAASAFERGLPGLTARLERLAYRVVRAGVGVAPPRDAAPLTEPPREAGSAVGLDLHA
ncbi:flagellar hook-length control protein FliK [bacterium]|nr:MAG: flagellar hook-length control protein FliK [bacterium]